MVNLRGELAKLVARHNVEIRGEHLILYKAVRGNFRPWGDRWQPADRTARPYKPGTLVVAHRFNQRSSAECAPGLHVGPWDTAVGWMLHRDRRNPNPVMRWGGFASTIVEVAVLPEDIARRPRGLSNSRYPKVRCRKLIVLRQVKPGTDAWVKMENRGRR